MMANFSSFGLYLLAALLFMSAWVNHSLALANDAAENIPLGVPPKEPSQMDRLELAMQTMMGAMEDGFARAAREVGDIKGEVASLEEEITSLKEGVKSSLEEGLKSLEEELKSSLEEGLKSTKQEIQSALEQNLSLAVDTITSSVTDIVNNANVCPTESVSNLHISSDDEDADDEERRRSVIFNWTLPLSNQVYVSKYMLSATPKASNTSKLTSYASNTDACDDTSCSVDFCHPLDKYLDYTLSVSISYNDSRSYGHEVSVYLPASATYADNEAIVNVTAWSIRSKAIEIQFDIGKCVLKTANGLRTTFTGDDESLQEDGDITTACNTSSGRCRYSTTKPLTPCKQYNVTVQLFSDEGELGQDTVGPVTIVEEPPTSSAPAPGSNCQDLLQRGHSCSGVYTLTISGKNVEVYCDMTTDGGGWTVIQRRDDVQSHVDFNRGWADYKRGFGDLEGEFWLGLDAIHGLTTTSTPMVLRVELEDWEGEERVASYSTFLVGGEVGEKYRLTVGESRREGLGGYAWDSLDYHNGRAFSTRDRDNDGHGGLNCAERHKGGWWYNQCLHANLNGVYLKGEHGQYEQGVIWRHWKGWSYSLRRAAMKIRPR